MRWGGENNMLNVAIFLLVGSIFVVAITIIPMIIAATKREKVARKMGPRFIKIYGEWDTDKEGEK
jgi:hypothetical protein